LVFSPIGFSCRTIYLSSNLSANRNDLHAEHAHNAGWCSCRGDNRTNWCTDSLLDATVLDGTSAESEWLSGTGDVLWLTVGQWLLD